MAYQAEISRANPSVFIFLIDQSGSMQDGFSGSPGRSKAEELADGVNRLLQNLIIKCTKSAGVLDYYEIGVIGYGSGKGVGPAFLAPLQNQDLVFISKVADNPARIEERMKRISDGAGGILESKIKFQVWFEPTAESSTPMYEALQYAERILKNWVAQHPSSYPPTVINITDGEATDHDPIPGADAIRQLSTADGNVVLLNCHLSSQPVASIQYPDKADNLPDNYARNLFAMSSVLPPPQVAAARSEGFAVTDHSRGFVFNAELTDMIRFLDIGTRPGNLR